MAAGKPKRRTRSNAEREFLAFVLDQLARLEPEPRAMFGGHGLYSGGKFFGIVMAGRLYLRTDHATRPAYEARGMAPFRPYAGRATILRYHEVPPDVLEDARELARWAHRAIATHG